MQILGGKHARNSRSDLNHNFSGGRVMRRFTFIAFPMRKVLTHSVFLWRRVCHTITRIAGSSGNAIYWLKFSTIISSQIITEEWNCNLDLQRIMPTPSILQGDAAFDLLGICFSLIEVLTLNNSPVGGQTCLLGVRSEGFSIISGVLNKKYILEWSWSCCNDNDFRLSHSCTLTRKQT